MEDQHLIKLFFARSDEAIEQLAVKYGKTMFAVSYNILQNIQDAEECVNDAYLGVWNAIPPAKPNPLCTFVCRITRNISLTKHKHNTAAKRHGGNTVDFEEIADCIPAHTTVTDEIETRELTEVLNAWLDTLSRQNLYIFMRRYWYMDSVTAIGEKLHMTESAVYLRIGRMKKNLYKYLTERGILL